MSYFITLGEGKLLNLSFVLLKTGPVEAHDTWNGIHFIQRGEKSGSPGLGYTTRSPLLMPDSAASPGQHVWYAQFGQIPKAAATLTFKDQATSVNSYRKGRQVPTKDLSL